ncbi:class I SAM-dependent methyltransferase [Scytonema sp. NUACC26]
MGILARPNLSGRQDARTTRTTKLPNLKFFTMANQTLGLEKNLYDYLLSVSVQEPEVLTKLRQETAQHPMSQMQIAPEQGQFMALLVQLMGAKRTLDIGIFTGYSSLVVALALPPEGKVVACDISEEYTAIARRYWQQAGVADKIELHIAPAMETLDRLRAQGETFDFAFIDADKSNYDNYYEQALQLVRPGGLIAIDNVLWSGRVADSQVQDNRTNRIRAFNQKLYQDSRVAISLVPIADGLTLALKK